MAHIQLSDITLSWLGKEETKQFGTNGFSVFSLFQHRSVQLLLKHMEALKTSIFNLALKCELSDPRKGKGANAQPSTQDVRKAAGTGLTSCLSALVWGTRSPPPALTPAQALPNHHYFVSVFECSFS